MGAEPSRPGTRHSDGPDDSSNLLSPGKGSRAPTSKGKAGSSFRCAEPAVDEPASPPPPPQRRPQAARAQQRGQGPKGKPSKRDMSSEPEPAPCPGYVRRRHLNSGSFGVAYLEEDMATGELVSIKYLPRGPKIDHNVSRELINHRNIRHRNIVMFKRAALTQTSLAIVMEYAAGGELFDRIVNSPSGHLNENDSRFYFQQLIAGAAFIHSLGIAHRDIKLENTLLSDPNPNALVKICDFGYSKSETLNSRWQTANVGTPSYLAPELLTLRPGQDYDGRQVDVWAAGVVLYVMLAGSYPFGDQADTRSLIKNIAKASFNMPVHITEEAKDLLRRIFTVDPKMRITVDGIRAHPWFVRDLPDELRPGRNEVPVPEGPGMQTVDELQVLCTDARVDCSPAAAQMHQPIEEDEYIDEGDDDGDDGFDGE